MATEEGSGASGRRHSIPDEAVVVADPQVRAALEAQNGLRQFDVGMAMVELAIERGDFKLRPSTLLTLHREALRDISSRAGNWRPAGVRIEGSGHEPAEAHLVPELVESLCDYVNERWGLASPMHLAAYVMWRLNWIHPFTDGNGRTSRIAAYVVLCVGLKTVLRGENTIPEQIVGNREPYFQALEAADAAFKAGSVDVSRMESLLEDMLATQLTSLIELATQKRF